MADEKPKPYLNEELLDAAVGFVTNGDHVPREVKDRVILAIGLDNRNDNIDMRERLAEIEDHPLHRLTAKRLLALLSGFVTLSAIYIEESRDFLVEILKAVLGLA